MEQFNPEPQDGGGRRISRYRVEVSVGWDVFDSLMIYRHYVGQLIRRL